MTMRWGPACLATATMARVASAITGPMAPRMLMTASAPFMAWETTARSVASPWTTWRSGLVMVSFSARPDKCRDLVASGERLLDQLSAGGAGGA